MEISGLREAQGGALIQSAKPLCHFLTYANSLAIVRHTLTRYKEYATVFEEFEQYVSYKRRKTGEKEGAMSYRLIITIIGVGLVLIFVIQNVTVVEIKFLLWSIEMSRSLLYFIILVIGLLCGWFLKGHAKHRKKTK